MQESHYCWNLLSAQNMHRRPEAFLDLDLTMLRRTLTCSIDASTDIRMVSPNACMHAGCAGRQNSTEFYRILENLSIPCRSNHHTVGALSILCCRRRCPSSSFGTAGTGTQLEHPTPRNPWAEFEDWIVAMVVHTVHRWCRSVNGDTLSNA